MSSIATGAEGQSAGIFDRPTPSTLTALANDIDRRIALGEPRPMVIVDALRNIASLKTTTPESRFATMDEATLLRPPNELPVPEAMVANLDAIKKGEGILAGSPTAVEYERADRGKNETITIRQVGGMRTEIQFLPQSDPQQPNLRIGIAGPPSMHGLGVAWEYPSGANTGGTTQLKITPEITRQMSDITRFLVHAQAASPNLVDNPTLQNAVIATLRRIQSTLPRAPIPVARPPEAPPPLPTSGDQAAAVVAQKVAPATEAAQPTTERSFLAPYEPYARAALGTVLDQAQTLGITDLSLVQKFVESGYFRRAWSGWEDAQERGNLLGATPVFDTDEIGRTTAQFLREKFPEINPRIASVEEMHPWRQALYRLNLFTAASLSLHTVVAICDKYDVDPRYSVAAQSAAAPLWTRARDARTSLLRFNGTIEENPGEVSTRLFKNLVQGAQIHLPPNAPNRDVVARRLKSLYI